MKKTLILSLGLVFVLQGVGLGYGWLSQPSSKMPETSFSDNQENTAAEKTLDFFVLSGMKDHEIVKTLSEMKHDRLADVFNAAFERPTLKLRAAIWLKGLEEKKQQAALKEMTPENILDFFTLSNMADYVIVGILSKMEDAQLTKVFSKAFERPTLKLRAAIWLKGLEEKKQQAALKEMTPENILDFFTLSNMADYVIVGILSKMDIGQLKDIFNTAFKNPTSKQRAAIWLKGLDSKMQAKILE